MTLREFCIMEKNNANSETKPYEIIEVRFTTDESLEIYDYCSVENISDVLKYCEDEMLDSVIIDIDPWDDMSMFVIDVMPKKFVLMYGMHVCEF